MAKKCLKCCCPHCGQPMNAAVTKSEQTAVEVKASTRMMGVNPTERNRVNFFDKSLRGAV